MMPLTEVPSVTRRFHQVLIGFTSVYVLTSIRSGPLHICSIPAAAAQSPSEQIRRTSTLAGARARRSNSAEFSNTSIRISKKRQTFLLIFLSGTLCVVVFITQTYDCGHEWMCFVQPGSGSTACQIWANTYTLNAKELSCIIVCLTVSQNSKRTQMSTTMRL